MKPTAQTTFRPQRKSHFDVTNWALLQSNLNDALNYLIEKEIAENGLRNLADIIPSKRTPKYFESLNTRTKSKSRPSDTHIQDNHQEPVSKLPQSNTTVPTTAEKIVTQEPAPPTVQVPKNNPIKSFVPSSYED